MNEPPSDPLQLAFAYLSRRERTVSEMRQHLLHREVRVEAVENVIDELTDQGYLDDARYARVFAEDKRELEQWGSERIRQVLLARGLDRELVADALAAHEDDNEGGELGRALALLRRRFPGPPRDRRERERALGVLLRKGYEPELALDAVAGYARQYQ